MKKWPALVFILLVILSAFVPIPYYQKKEVCKESNPPQCSHKGWYLSSSLVKRLSSEKPVDYNVSPSPGNKPQSPMSLSISLKKVPQKDREIQFIASASSSIAAPHTSITVELAPNISILEGDSHWEGDLAANEPKDVKLILQYPADGSFEITAKALSKPSANFWFGREKKLCVKLNSSAVTAEDGPCTKYDNNSNQTTSIEVTPNPNQVRPSSYEPLGKKSR